jgi:predicted nucleotidyltransferase
MRSITFLLLSLIFTYLLLVSTNITQADIHKNTPLINISNNSTAPHNVARIVSSQPTLHLTTKRSKLTSRLSLTTVQKKEQNLQVKVYNSSPNFYSSMLIFNDKLQQYLTSLKEVDLRNIIDTVKSLITL